MDPSLPPQRGHPRGPHAALHDAPRHQPACVKLLDQDVQIADGFSFYRMYQEIFIDGIHGINIGDPEASIIDCGASYGGSALYCKSRFPRCSSKDVASDPTTFSLLAANSKNHAHSGGTLFKKAVAAKSNLSVPFYSLGADIGRLHGGATDTPPVLVPTICLNDLIDDPTGFLKIDIERSEAKVVHSITKLRLAKQMFVEHPSFKETRKSPGELHDIFAQEWRSQLSPGHLHSPPSLS